MDVSALKFAMEDALRSIAEKKNISPSDIETATKAMCALEQIKMMEGGSESSYRRGRRSYDGSYDGSYEGSHLGYEGTSNDGSMISRTGSHRRSHDGSYEQGYSGHSIKDRMVAKLEEMYDQAKTEHERQIVDEWINRLDGKR